ncbi:MAG: glycosyltransferase family 87 protein [Arenicellales bacterium]|nr:glycosyltransferase family 87 protein [Arenicellales bacterium]
MYVVVKKSIDPIDYENTFLTYRDAAIHWLNTEPLYNTAYYGFIYLPQSALLFTPFAYIPAFLGTSLWPVLNIGMFAVGIYSFAQLASRRYRSELFLPMTIVSIAMAMGAAKSGQMTLIMAGLMMVALVDLTEKNWWRAASMLILSLAFKPLSIVLILLVAVLYPRARIPLLVALAVLLLVPFTLQDPGYVWEQYATNLQTITHIANETREIQFAQVFWMLGSAGVDIPDTVQFAIRLLFAMLTLGLGWWLRGKQEPDTFAIYLYSLAVIYLMLFNTRTENNTYVMLAPALAVFTVWAFQSQKFLWGCGYFAVTVMFVLSYKLGKVLTGTATIWMKPMLCCVFLLLILGQLYQEYTKNRLTSA